MYICLCARVTDRQVVGLVQEGCRDLAAIGRRCGAGTHCGICLEDVQQIIDETDGRSVAGREPTRAG